MPQSSFKNQNMSKSLTTTVKCNYPNNQIPIQTSSNIKTHIAKLDSNMH